MKNIYLFCGLLILVGHSVAQNPPSPGSFLGYPLGSRYTPHYKIVNYFREVAKAAPDRVKLEQYGETYEGRPLLLAYIASPGNLQRLEAIRVNNLKLAGVLFEKTAPDENAPAVVWLSYNVHGNEPSSSEAAMKTIYELTNPDNAKAKEWLEHTVVIIDPCINPDGRDRYVNWYTTAVGKDPNPDVQSREHSEPWPGGRSNHYNFDLNRDWAWQTQQETRQRLKKYNAWLPQVHVDFHEQGVNSPYYFAPAAEPYHDVITPWQREFQVMIGKNNAKYFDERGWLYFTREEFDLFYPSYGDTYPTYNGAIGMTFEQGGGNRGGVAVITSDDDTLTLSDRLEHHFTTGMSAIEVASRNASGLVREFRKYFSDASTKPSGEFRAWLIRNDQYGDRLERLESLLERNNIEWAGVIPGNFTGVDYETGKIASFRSGPGDIVIPASQPKAALLRVLFERNSRISDSVTYDITAWSIPFVYGLQAYGVTTYTGLAASTPAHPPAISPGDAGRGKGWQSSPPLSATATGNGPAVNAATPALAGEYAYVVRWTGMNSAKFLTSLLKKGVRTRFSEQTFQSGGIEFEKGSLIIAPTGNGSLPGNGSPGKNLAAILSETAQRTGVTLNPVASGFVEKGADFGSGHVHLIHRPKVAVLTGEGVSSLNAGEVWHFFEQELDYPITQINAGDAARIDWKNYDVVILPNGHYRFLEDKNTADPLKNWVREGGRIIAMENSVAQLSRLEWGIRQKGGDDKKEGDKEKKPEDYSSLHRYENREREQVASSVPGSIYKVELDNSHPLAFGYPDHYYTLKQDDRVYEFIKEGGWNVGFIKKDNYISGFTGNKAKEKLKDGLIFGVQDMGRGEIVFLADDPLFRSFWENGKLLFCNAVFLVGE